MYRCNCIDGFLYFLLLYNCDIFIIVIERALSPAIPRFVKDKEIFRIFDLSQYNIMIDTESRNIEYNA